MGRLARVAAPVVVALAPLAAASCENGSSGNEALSAQSDAHAQHETGNDFETSRNLEGGDSQTILGRFVTDETLHCHFHPGMELEIVVNHTATTVGEAEPRTVDVIMTDNTFEPVEIGVGHGEEINFDVSNAGQNVHNVMAGEHG